jgi:hypothetical protein
VVLEYLNNKNKKKKFSSLASGVSQLSAEDLGGFRTRLKGLRTRLQEFFFLRTRLKEDKGLG